MGSKILIVSLALLAALAAAPALAEVDEGWRYSYVYSFTRGGKSVSGTASLEVVEVFEDGRVRLRFESSFNDGIAVVEKNMPAHAFNIPRIPWEDPSGSLTYTRDGVSYTLTVLETGRGERTVGGRTYQTIVYTVSGTYSDANHTVSGEARLEVLSGSGIIYSLEGNLRGREKTSTFSMQLTDANFDLNSLPAPESTDRIYMQAYFLQALQNPDQATLPTPSSITPVQTQQADDPGMRAVLAGVVGVGAIAVVSFIGMRRRRVGIQGAVKPHYV